MWGKNGNLIFNHSWDSLPRVGMWGKFGAKKYHFDEFLKISAESAAFCHDSGHVKTRKIVENEA